MFGIILVRTYLDIFLEDIRINTSVRIQCPGNNLSANSNRCIKRLDGETVLEGEAWCYTFSIEEKLREKA